MTTAFQATVDGKTVAIINNCDGSYTIKNVTGKLVISANSTPTVKTYAVTVKGDGSGDVSASTSATHGRNYTFTVTQAANYDYAVAVTVNGQPVTCTVSSSGSRLYLHDPGGGCHRPGGHYGEEGFQRHHTKSCLRAAAPRCLGWRYVLYRKKR